MTNSFRVRILVLGILMVGLPMLVIGASPAYAARAQPAEMSNIPAVQVLNPNDTLNLQKGASGSIDLSAWQVSRDPPSGPSSVLQAPAANSWSTLRSGLNDVVHAMAISGSNVYAGGDFSQVCGNAACNSGNSIVNHIARWDGSNWSALGNGFNAPVYALVVNGNDVYAGGLFTEVCGNAACDSGNITVNGVAKWDGSSWSALGDGLNLYTGTFQMVFALAFNGGKLYAGGRFSEICGNLDCDTDNITAHNLARWDGGTWYGIDYGVNKSVRTLAFDGNKMYVGGEFTEVCGNEACDSDNIPASRIAAWDGEDWFGLGYGVSYVVYAIAISNSDVYVGGGFLSVCGNSACDSGNTTVSGIAKWSSATSSWTLLGHGFDGYVYGLAASGSDVYAVGYFHNVCGNVACNSGNTLVYRVAKWNGTSWSPLAHGFIYTAYAVSISGNDVYAGGWFSHACGNDACNDNPRLNYIAKYGPAAACATKPAKPALALPTNNATVKKNKLNLQWAAANCASTYNVTIQDSTGKKVESAKNLQVLNYKPTKVVKGKTYKWFIQACNTQGCTKSQVQSFKVK